MALKKPPLKFSKHIMSTRILTNKTMIMMIKIIIVMIAMIIITFNDQVKDLMVGDDASKLRSMLECK